MDEKEIIRAVHDYQFVVYTPQKKKYIKRVTKDGFVLEITSHIYPYRKFKFDYTWLEAFRSKQTDK